MPTVPKSSVSWQLLTLLCIICFIAGRFFHGAELISDLSNRKTQAGAGDPVTSAVVQDASSQTTVEDTLEDNLEDSDDIDFLFPLNLDDPTYPGHKQLKQLANVLKMKKNHPAVPVGESGEGFYRFVPFQVLSWHPRLVLLPNFASKSECESLMHLADSDIEYHENDGDEVEGMVLGPYSGDSIIQTLNDRIAAFTRLPYELIDSVKLYRHTDDKTGYPPNWQTETRHLASVLLFLSDVEEGGDTLFPYEGVHGLERKIEGDACKSSEGYRVPPRMGDALFLWRQDYHGEIDNRAEYWTCAVKKGAKWVAVFRIRDRTYNDGDTEEYGSAPDS